jgi:hypothetical protein
MSKAQQQEAWQEACRRNQQKPENIAHGSDGGG